jgi:hypothetical protein
MKHDGYRLMVRRDGARVRCFTRNGHDWADRFPAIVEAALRVKAASFLIDGEAVIARDDGTPDFRALRKAARARLAGLSLHAREPIPRTLTWINTAYGLSAPVLCRLGGSSDAHIGFDDFDDGHRLNSRARPGSEI